MALSDTETLHLSDFLAFRLSVLSNTISRQIAERYDKEFGLSIGQWRVMAVVGEQPGITATELSEHTAMDKVAVSRAAASLIDLGYLERRAVQSDGRRSHLHLSDDGRRVHGQILPLAKSYEQALTEALSPKDLGELRRLLDAVARQVSPTRDLW